MLPSLLPVVPIPSKETGKDDCGGYDESIYS